MLVAKVMKMVMIIDITLNAHITAKRLDYPNLSNEFDYKRGKK